MSPSLSSSSPLDKQIKTMVLSDTFHLVGFKLFDRKKLELEQAKKDKMRLLGFEPSKKQSSFSSSNASTTLQSELSPEKEPKTPDAVLRKFMAQNNGSYTSLNLPAVRNRGYD